jgi:hypothetical protein
MRGNLRLSGLLILALGFLLPQAASAQQEGTKIPVPHDQVISANPFLLLWEWTNVEYERKISPTSTMGAQGSWISLDKGDEDYLSLSAFVRHYPQGAALSGFYLGGIAGFYQVSDRNDQKHAFGLGIEVGYSWLFGAKRNFYLSMGFGAVRRFGGDVGDGSFTLPSVRLLNIGWAF